MFAALIGISVPLLVIGMPTFVLAIYRYINQKQSRERYESFEQAPRSFRSHLSDSYGIVILCGILCAVYYVGINAWNLAHGKNPTNATPYIAIIAVAIAAFSLFTSMMSAFSSLASLRQTRVTSSGQVICYMMETDEGLAIRFENASTSSAAYDVKAVVDHENTCNYIEPTRPFLGKGTTIINEPVFPPSCILDFDLSRAKEHHDKHDFDLIIQIEWTSFHGQRLGGAFRIEKARRFRPRKS